MIRRSFRAMGTEVIVLAESSVGAAATAAFFAAAERRLSRFLPDSELSVVNQDPRCSVEVSHQLEKVLALAVELRERTGGLVDPAVGGDVARWGYEMSLESVTGLALVPATTELPGDWHVAAGRVHREPGVVLDLGGIAKGWACDTAVESGMAILVSAGGDLRSATPDTIAEIADPWSPGVAARVAVGVGALATSSVTRRRWKVGGGEAHHIIDPRTGEPAASPILSATVTCATAVEAEAGAKAVLLAGEAGLRWADDRPWIQGALACWDTGSVFATGTMEVAA